MSPLIIEIRCHTVPPRWIFVSVTTDDGLTGWGEAIVPKRKSAVLGAVADLTRGLVGKEAGRIEDHAQAMRKGGFFRRGPIIGTAAASIETALWDLKGKRAGMAVHDMLGGPVRETLRSYCWIGGDKPGDVVAHARERIQAGFDAVKMNATASVPTLGAATAIDELVERMGSLRDAYGMSIDIALDLHGRVPRTVLKQLIREIEPFRPMWIEEATLPEAEDSAAMLARLCPHIPIATGERLLDRWDFKRLMTQGGVDIVQPDVSITGLFELEKIARMAEAFDVAVAPHCPNGPVSLAASLQVGFCCANVSIQEQSLGLHYNKGYANLPAADLLDYLADTAPLGTESGRFARPQGPGLGIEIDAEKVASAETDWSLPDAGWRHEDGTFAEW
ncbi:galactonate dehydratase [Aurantimonas sp. VKM B-3413]|uniref:galactonate dehydratase n=1 Tax=Aurantimonas sp. VKM B-3413 TaxID=2779401 RepID=UPI001E4CA26E|nr:galactonate dehydratase [Aurantimonas sp. VKM B-3413]